MLIGVAGAAGVGKSTLVEFCERVLGFRQRSFAAPLKQIVQELYDFSDQQMYGASQFRNAPDERYPRGDGTFLTARLALERFGTEAGRYCYRDTWCNRPIAMAVADLLGGAPGVALADARFINEFEAIRRNGGYVIRLVRAGIGYSDHESESEQGALPDSYFDLVLDTSFSKADTQTAFMVWYINQVRVAA